MRILIADDSLLSRRLLEETLRSWGYDVIVAADGEEAWRILSGEHSPSLAVLDWMMPGRTGPELCRLVRQRAAEPYTYILLLTSRNEKDDVVEGMDSGADDYITKPFDKHELKVRLRAGTRIVDLQEQLVAAREALRIQATRDYLTPAMESLGNPGDPASRAGPFGTRTGSGGCCCRRLGSLQSHQRHIRALCGRLGSAGDRPPDAGFDTDV